MPFNPLSQRIADYERRRAIADAMMQSARTPLQSEVSGTPQYPIVVRKSPLEALGKIGEAWMARGESKKLDAERDAIAAEMGKRRSGAVQDLQESVPDSQVGAETLRRIRMAPDETLVRPTMSRTEAAQNAIDYGIDPSVISSILNPKTERVDRGDRIDIVDSSGRTVSSFSKGVDPSAQLSSDTARRGQDLSSETARRGQDITATTTRRGQDVAANTARTNAQNPKRTEYDKKASLLYGEMVDAEKQYRQTPGTDTSSKWNAVLNTNPITRVFTGEDFRKHEAAGMRWAQNFLYLKSGASAPAEEVRKTFVQYLPQPGDTPPVIEQKKRAREEAMKNVATSNGLETQDWGSGPASSVSDDDLLKKWGQ